MHKFFSEKRLFSSVWYWGLDVTGGEEEDEGGNRKKAGRGRWEEAEGGWHDGRRGETLQMRQSSRILFEGRNNLTPHDPWPLMFVS